MRCKDTDKVLADSDRDSVEAWVASLHRQRQVRDILSTLGWTPEEWRHDASEP